jgi:hypothetical protein
MKEYGGGKHTGLITAKNKPVNNSEHSSFISFYTNKVLAVT